MATASTAIASTPQQWQLVFKTADVPHAGTDPTIFCRLMTDGRNVSTSPKIRCSDAKKDKKSFKKGGTDTYKFTLPKALEGSVNAIQVWHENKDNRWRPSGITLSGAQKAVFHVPKDTEIDDDAPATFYVGGKTLGEYTIEIQTSDSFGAGTDAKVEINLIGKKSSSLFHVLDNKGNDRERGDKDIYKIKSHDLGEITDVKLNIKKTNTWGGAWNIDYVKVSSGAGNEFTFKLNGKEFKPGNTYSLSSPVYTKNSQPEESKKPKPAPAPANQNLGSQCQTMYEGEIETADEVGAGTDAQVKIWFTDNNGQVVGPLGITEVDGDTMEQGHKNKITVELTQKMDGLAKISLQHGGQGLGSDWKMKQAKFQQLNPATKQPVGDEQVFFFDKVLKSKQVYDILPAADKKSRTALTKYKIEVVTSDKLWAGTDDTVKINLKGSKGTSEFRKLDNAWKNDFERGSTSKFELEMADLGVLQSVQLKKNGRDDWRCKSVTVIKGSEKRVANFNDVEIRKEPVQRTFN